MLVMSRLRDEAIFVSDAAGECLLTVVDLRGDQVRVSVAHSPADQPGRLDARTMTLVRGGFYQIGTLVKITLVDIRADKARLGITAEPTTSVHRFEVWQALKDEAERIKQGGDADEGLAGLPVPRPGGPKPPSLDVRLSEPRGNSGPDVS